MAKNGISHEPPSRTAQILIVEDHPIVREGYSQLIATQPDLRVCAFAASETEALAAIQATEPDLAVIDLTLQDSHGMELMKQIAASHPTVKMLVISAHDESVFAERAVDAGALGYINKQEATDKLIDGIRHVLRGDFYLSDRITERLLKRKAGRAQRYDRSPIERLSNRELEVFEAIGHGLGTRQIADTMHVSPKTVERFRENIKTKLDLANATELVQHATQWVLEGG